MDDPKTKDEEFIYAFKSNIKDTVEDELSDACIRLLDLAGSLDISLEDIKASIVVIFLNADLLYIDLLWHIEQKQRYNELRENKHGKRY